MEVFVARAVRANRGDLASQAGLVDGLLSSSEVERVYVSTYYPHHFAGEDRVVPVNPPPLRAMLSHRQEQALLARRLPVFWGGGVDLQDSGSKIKMPLILLRIRLLKRHGSPFIQAFQGVGPIESRVGRILLRRITREFDWSIVREPTARDLLLTLGRLSPQKLDLACDAALLLPSPDRSFGIRYLRDAGLDPEREIIGLNLRRWFHQRGGWLPTEVSSLRRASSSSVAMTRLMDNVAGAVCQLLKDGATQLLMLPMYRRHPEPWEDDILLLEELRRRLPEGVGTAFVDEDLAPTDLVSILSSVDLLIGVRLHSTILAHVAGVPSIHIAYEPKGVDHFRQMGLERYVIDIEDLVEPTGERELAAAIDSIMEDPQRLKRQVQAGANNLRENARTSLHTTIAKLIDR